MSRSRRLPLLLSHTFARFVHYLLRLELGYEYRAVQDGAPVVGMAAGVLGQTWYYHKRYTVNNRTRSLYHTRRVR